MTHRPGLPWLAALLVLGVLTGTARAQLGVSADPVAIPASAVPTPSSRPFQVTEGSAATTDDLDVDVTAASCALFAVDTPRITVTTAAAATVTATYTPAARGTVTCHARLLDHGTTTQRLAFDITGTGTGPALTVTPNPVTFAAARVTGGGSTQLVTLKNTGESNLTITGLTPVAGTEFTVQTAPTLPLVLAPNATATATLAFAPSAAGTRTDTLQIVSDAVGAATTSVPLSGTGTNAVLTVSNVAFGTVLDAGAASVKAITIANTGALPLGTLTVSQAVLADTSGWFAFDTSTGCAGQATCPLALAVGATPASLKVSCLPTPLTASGTQTATVTFTSDSDPGATNVATLTCTAGRPAIVLGAPAPTLAFGGVAVNTSQTLSFTVHNAGTSALTYSFPALVAPYAVTSGACAPCTIAAGGADKTISVKFLPTAMGDASATLTLTTNDPDPGNGSIAISLDGVGASSQITGAPTTLAFGGVDVGKSAASVLTVSNSGNAPLHIASAALTGATVFTVTDGLLTAQTVAPGASVTWTITCQPTATGSKTGQLQILSDSLANPTANVALTCTGQLGALAAAPTPFDFGGVRQGDTKTQTFTLTNAGNVPVSGITATLANTAIGYAITTPPPASIAGGGTGTMVVTFAPQSAGDGGPNQVTIAGAWGTTPQTPITATIDLTGAERAAGYDVSTTALALGDVRWDQSATGAFTIQLTDAAPIQITAIDLAVDPATTQTGEITRVSLQKNGAPVTAFPIALTALTDVITVGVRAAPASRLGPMKATVTVTSDLGMTPARQVVVTANSVSPMLALDPSTATLEFGAVDVDGPAITKSITLTNSGSGALSVGAITSADPQGTFAIVPPASPTTLAPGASTAITVTYTPTLEESDAATVTIPLAGIFGSAPGNQVIAITGQGIDRHLSLATTALTFPPTFRYPTTPPQLPVHIANTGAAPLHIHMAEITGSTAFALVGGGSATIPGGGSDDVIVTFDPHAAGAATQGVLELVNDDTAKGQPDAIARVTLDGLGLDRDVGFGPTTVSLGTVGIGIPRKITDLAADGLQVTSMDATTTFHIQSITVDDPQLALIGAPQGADLAPGQTLGFDAALTATAEGPFSAVVALYLDADPDPRATVTVTGTAVFADAHGGGGCQAGGGGAGGSLVLAAAIGALARRRRRAAAVATLAACALAAPRADADRNLDAQVFHPTPATEGGAFGVQSAGVGAPGDFALTALVSYADKPIELVAGASTDALVASRALIDLGGAYAVLDRLELAAHMPLYSQSGDPLMTGAASLGEAPATGTARGDLSLHAKARLVGARDATLQLGLAAALTLPTATADQFVGVAKPEGRALALLTLAPVSRLAVHVNAGAILRARASYANVDQKSGAAWGVGATYRLLDALWLDGEIYGEWVPSGVRTGPPDASGHAPTAALDTIEALVGVRYQIAQRTSLSAAIGRGASDGFGAPALRGVLSLAFSSGARALPPIHPPPPPKIDGDADGDGVRDSVDKCPNEPEDRDGFEDEDGCPDPDNDKDGIPDAQDKCPLGAEDKDGFQDEDGCPDLDNDKDGILDAKDKCPLEPEDRDGFEDGDGCPDPDNDHDGIPDVKDKCPNQPETINGVEDEDGCPDTGDALVVVSLDRMDLLDTVRWNGAAVARSSYGLLGQIGATLRAHDEILRVRVTVHVQPSGNAAHDKDLSERRAQAVRDWLVQWGVAAKRLEAKGFGGTKPLLAPTKPGAASVNERLELIILERK